ncbi:conjugal transfer protein TraG [Vibrio sp. MACH09]|uniref:conjugal transfer protein TraG N-terminal domain-containing protein n=1 Tax=Vibrio sp. MACH09 TaxID=3025122 RepID=UPI00279197FD|nr:conjugal transfer protein TraG N-terminal domain-containing protein [Vibrio sp. MACH09]GLO64078.1 conjugal transfer protein TraG [Vibrio sp. MACH09]
MIVNDPLSLMLTLEGWYIANKIMIVLNQTNIMMFMLTVVVFQVWVDVAQEGEDEGNKGALALNRTEVKIAIAFLVCFLAVLPLFPANVNQLTLDQSASKECGVGISSGSTNSSQSSFNGEKVFVPIWWAFWHSISQGVTNAAVSSIPCSYDVDRGLLQLKSVGIVSEPLKQEVQDFYEQCFTRARIAMKAGGREGTVIASDYNTANWLGGRYFLKENRFSPKTSYQNIQAEKAVFTFPYKSERDDPVQTKYSNVAINPSAAYPYCHEWWESEEPRLDGQWAGLKWRIYNNVNDHNPKLVKEIIDDRGFFASLLGNKTTQRERADMLIQRVLSVENQQTSGRIVRGYGNVLDKSWDHEIREIWNASAGLVGLEAGHFLTGPTFFIIREAMPIFQAALMTFVIIASPIVLTIGSFNVMTLMSLSLTYAGLAMLTFWWELCRSIDSKLLEGLYSMHDNLNPITGTLNIIDDAVLKFVIIILYVMMPLIWFGLLGFAGYKVNALGIDSALDKLQQPTKEGTSLITQNIKK